MSRGGGDYRDAFRDDRGTYAERELGARAFVAGHPARLRDSSTPSSSGTGTYLPAT